MSRRKEVLTLYLDPADVAETRTLSERSGVPASEFYRTWIRRGLYGRRAVAEELEMIKLARQRAEAATERKG